MDIEVSRHEHGVVFSSIDRVDAFNFDRTKSTIEKSVAGRGLQVAFDLSHAKFLSLKTIKFIHGLSEDLKSRGGQVALIGPSEKLKRQIDIFASLDDLLIFKTESDWSRSTCVGES